MLQEIVGAVPVSRAKESGSNSHARPHDFIEKKGEITMSSNEISKALKELYELRAMKSELEDEITALEDRVKAEMAERGVDELEGAGHTAKYSESFSSERRIVPLNCPN